MKIRYLLLRAIDATISSLCYSRRIFEAITSFAQDVAGNLKTNTRGERIDSDGEADSNLLKAQESTKDLYDLLKKRRESAKHDLRLTEEDGVSDEYLRTIMAVGELHNALNLLRWSISEHDASVSAKEDKNPKVFTSAEDIKTYLRAL